MPNWEDLIPESEYLAQKTKASTAMPAWDSLIPESEYIAQKQAPAARDTGAGLGQGVAGLAATTDLNHWQNLAQQEIANRRAGRTLEQVSPGVYSPVETLGNQYEPSPSEQAAIFDAYRKKYDIFGAAQPQADMSQDFARNQAQITQAQIAGQGPLTNAGNAIAADFLSLPIHARVLASRILGAPTIEEKKQLLQQAGADIATLNDNLLVDPSSVMGLVGHLTAGAVKYGTMMPAAVAEAGGQPMIASQQQRDAGVPVSETTEALRAAGSMAATYGAGKLTGKIGEAGAEGITDPVSKGIMQMNLAGAGGGLSMGGLAAEQQAIEGREYDPMEVGRSGLVGAVAGPIMHLPGVLAGMRPKAAAPEPVERRVAQEPTEFARRKDELIRKVDEQFDPLDKQADKLVGAGKPETPNPFEGKTDAEIMAEIQKIPPFEGKITAEVKPRMSAEEAKALQAEPTGPKSVADYEQDIRDTQTLSDWAKGRLQTEPAMPPEERASMEKMVDHGAAEIQKTLAEVEQVHGENAAEDLLMAIQKPKVAPPEVVSEPVPAAPPEIKLATAESVKPELMGGETRQIVSGKTPQQSPKRDLKRLLAGKPVETFTPPKPPEEPAPVNKPETKLFSDLLRKKTDPSLMSWEEAKNLPVTKNTPEPEVLFPKAPPAAKTLHPVLEYGRRLVRETGEWMGSDIGLKATDIKRANLLREMQGNQRKAAVELEAVFEPDIKLAEKLTPDEAAALVNEVDQGIPTGDPQFKDFQQKMKVLNTSNIARAKAIGWDSKKWSSDWIGRLFEFPDETGKFPGQTGYSGTGKSIAGSEKFLKSRTYDTYAEALDAVESMGGRPKYANPVEMALAKSIEVSNSLLAHETFKIALDSGAVRKVKDGRIGPNEALIDDPIRWTHDDSSQFAASKDVAYLFNHRSSEGTSSRVLDLLLAGNRAATRIRMALDTRHYWTEALGASKMMYGQAWRDLFRGNVKSAAREAALGTPFAGLPFIMRRGGKLVKETRAGGSDVSKAVAMGGADTGPVHSILEDSDWVAMKKAYIEGDMVKAVSGLVNNTVGQINKTLFERYIPPIRKGISAIIAESEIANAQKRGININSAGFKDIMAKHAQHLNNMLGVENSGIHFQNKTAATVSRLIFGLPNWFLGKVRADLDAVRGLAPLFKGKNADPATYGLLGSITTTAILGTVAYAAFNGGKMPTKWADLRRVPTPWKDDNGETIRLTIPYPWEATEDVYTGDRSVPEAVKNRFSPLMAFTADMVKGQDFRGAPTRDTWHDVLRSLVDNFATPFGVSNAQRPGSTPALQALGIAGINRSAKKFGRTDAEREAMDAIEQSSPQGRKTHEEIAHSDLTNQLARDIRNGNKDAFDQLGTALTSGKLTPADVKSIMEKVHQEPGLPRLLNSPEIHPKELLRIWDKMTPEEKQKNRPAMLGRIGRMKASYDFSVADKLAAMQKVASP